jgi:hypothetical protein
MMLLVLIFLCGALLADSITPKFCINCKYFVKPPAGMNEFAKCSLFLVNNPKFLIDGVHRQSNYRYCYTAREFDSLCGKNATKYKKRYTWKRTDVNSTTTVLF